MRHFAVRRIWTIPIAVALVLGTAACGGGDDDATQVQVQPTATAATPTPPISSSATPAASTPTTPAPTATSAAVASSTRPPATVTPTVVTTPTVGLTATPRQSVEDTVLVASLLGLPAFPDGWALDRIDVETDRSPDQETLCDLNEFEGWDTRISHVTGSFSSGDGTEAFIQNITSFDGTQSLLAIRFARQQLRDCVEWTSSTGITFTISPSDIPPISTDVWPVHIAFDTNGQHLEGEWVFARVHQLVATFAYFGPDGSDLTPLYAAVRDALPRLEIASTELFDPGTIDDVALASDLASRLLLTDDLVPLSDGWLEIGVRLPDDPDRYRVCDLDLFTETQGALGEIQNEYAVDPDNGPFFWQSVSSFPAGTATDVMAHIRDMTGCQNFLDASGNGASWQILDRPAFDAGDETYAMHLGIDLGDQGSAQGAYVFVRAGDVITVLITIVANSDLDLDALAAVASAAGDELERWSE